MIIMEETWEEAIDRLVGYMAEGTLTEDDYDEVAERVGTSREEVIDACILKAQRDKNSRDFSDERFS